MCIYFRAHSVHIHAIWRPKSKNNNEKTRTKKLYYYYYYYYYYRRQMKRSFQSIANKPTRPTEARKKGKEGGNCRRGRLDLRDKKLNLA
jgi:hypothetical protein